MAPQDFDPWCDSDKQTDLREINVHVWQKRVAEHFGVMILK